MIVFFCGDIDNGVFQRTGGMREDYDLFFLLYLPAQIRQYLCQNRWRNGNIQPLSGFQNQIHQFIHNLLRSPDCHITLLLRLAFGHPGQQAFLFCLQAPDDIAAELGKGNGRIAGYVFFHNIGGALFHKSGQCRIGVGAGDAGALGRFIAGQFAVGEQGQVQSGLLPCQAEVQQFFCDRIHGIFPFRGADTIRDRFFGVLI